MKHEMNLESQRPGEQWSQAFPLGNGQIGAMVYGNVPQNQIALSENTFFSGKKEMDNKQEKSAEAFYRMRQLAEKEDFEGVHREAESFIGQKGNYGSNLPVGNLYLDYGIAGQQVQLIKRKLNIMTGLSETEMRLTSSDTNTLNHISETIFASHPAHCLVIK